MPDPFILAMASFALAPPGASHFTTIPTNPVRSSRRAPDYLPDPRPAPRPPPRILRAPEARMHPYDRAMYEWLGLKYWCYRNSRTCFDRQPLPSDFLRIPEGG